MDGSNLLARQPAAAHPSNSGRGPTGHDGQPGFYLPCKAFARQAQLLPPRPQTRQLSPDIVLVTYVATVCGPQAYKGDVNCSSLWQRQNGKWLAVSHTEALAAKN